MGHIHADLMAQYAEDAKHHDHPWELWQHGVNGTWLNCESHPGWGSNSQYRRKPRSIIIGDIEVPEPCREPLHSKQRFWVVNLFIGPQHFTWDGSKEDYHALNCGFVHLTEEAAQQHYEAIKSLLV